MPERIQESAKNTPIQKQVSQSSTKSFAPQAQQNSQEVLTQEEMENEEFQQHKFEAFGLQLKKEGGRITPEQQERLDVLQAKMDDFWVQRREKAIKSSYNVESILHPAPVIRDPENIQLQPRDIQLRRADVSLQPIEQVFTAARRKEINRIQKDDQVNSLQSYQLPTIQRKLYIGQPNDRYEQEAGRIASRVVQRINSPENSQSNEEQLIQRQGESERANRTGLPDALKAGVENLSGYSLDDVKVHYNSPKPAQVQALAYTQGADIHVAPGQEKHLPHEAWHVVQQVQGRVKPTMQMKDVQINDDEELEREADVMGEKALHNNHFGKQQIPIQKKEINGDHTIQRKVFLFSDASKETALTVGAQWFATKPSNLAPSDPNLYIEGIQTQYPNHTIVDMSLPNYRLEPGETAIIVAHGALGGGPDSFVNDNSEVVTGKVVEAVGKIIILNLTLERESPLRIFVAACNSARNVLSVGGIVGNSPIQKIIDDLKIHELVQRGAVIFEGYTAQAGLGSYEEQHVGAERLGTHIWGRNKVLSSGDINDKTGNEQMQKIFGYDTAVTARAIVDKQNRVVFSRQSLPLGDFNMPLEKIRQNWQLWSTMSRTSAPVPQFQSSEGEILKLSILEQVKMYMEKAQKDLLANMNTDEINRFDLESAVAKIGEAIYSTYIRELMWEMSVLGKQLSSQISTGVQASIDSTYPTLLKNAQFSLAKESKVAINTKELHYNALLGVNNCLIVAMNSGVNPSLMHIQEIRGLLAPRGGGAGEQLFASQHVIQVIAETLGITNRMVRIYYQDTNTVEIFYIDGSSKVGLMQIPVNSVISIQHRGNHFWYSG